MQDIDLNSITVDPINVPVFSDNEILADALRLDKIHSLISGNKWFKLRYYIEEAKQLNKKTLLSFGGAWSNHIIAMAAAGQLYGFKTTGIIRGEKPAELSPTLQQAKAMGMHLIFSSRDDYQQKIIPAEISDDTYFINEGGYGIKGAKGASTILDHCRKENYSHICCAAGTGTMAAGLANAADPSTTIIAISVLKNNPGIGENIISLVDGNKNKVVLVHDYHFGGYAKWQAPLIDFMNAYYRQSNIHSDFVYTGKLFYAISDLAAKKHFPPGSRLLLIHSGGLQGNDSLNKGTLIF